jgi:iron complex transport system ATP-binding protein
MALVEVQDASFSYGAEDVFQGIGFSLDRGEVFCLFGPNGCGKTTLLDCIMGILKLARGSIFLNQNNILGLNPQAVARYISFVPQVHVKTFPYRVIDVVVMGRACYTGFFRAPSAEDMEIAEEALGMVGLTYLKEKPYTKLSGGETQLVLVARALAQNTPLMVMDEPTAHLDFKHELIVLETIVGLVKKKGISVIMATHFPNHAYYFENNDVPTTVALMGSRCFKAIGYPSQVLTEENMASVFGVSSKILTCNLDGSRQLKNIVPINTLG